MTTKNENGIKKEIKKIFKEYDFDLSKPLPYKEPKPIPGKRKRRFTREINRTSLKKGHSKELEERKGENKQKNCVEQIELNEKRWLHGDKIDKIDEDEN